MRFSVIIPVRTINDNLKECVSHLKKVTYYDFEVIIVLDNYIKINFGLKETRFKAIESGEVSPGEKRNFGAKAASGDVLVFLDDDAFPTANWLRAAANIFEEDKELYALGGPAITPTKASFLEKMSGRVLESVMASGNTVYRHKPMEEREIDDFPSVNLFVKKDAFDAVGGFDTNYWPGEDTKLCFDLIKHFGKKFKYSPDPVVFHHRREMFKPYFQQVSRYGKHRGWFARIFPKNSRKLMYFIPSVFLIGAIGGIFASILYTKLFVYYFFILFVYLVLVFTEAQKVSMDDRDFTAFKYVFFGIIGTHYYYGLNFLQGFFFKPKLELREVEKETGNYVGG